MLCLLGEVPKVLGGVLERETNCVNQIAENGRKKKKKRNCGNQVAGEKFNSNLGNEVAENEEKKNCGN